MREVSGSHFDVQPGFQLAECAAVDETRRAALHRVLEEFITRMAFEEPTHLLYFNIPRFDERIFSIHVNFKSDTSGKRRCTAEVIRLAANLNISCNPLSTLEQQGLSNVRPIRP